jgi:hypothetical protein
MADSTIRELEPNKEEGADEGASKGVHTKLGEGKQPGTHESHEDTPTLEESLTQAVEAAALETRDTMVQLASNSTSTLRSLPGVQDVISCMTNQRT